MVSDWIIKKKLKDLKDSTQGAVHMKGKTTEVEKAGYSASLETVTFNITSPAWREEGGRYNSHRRREERED